MTETSTMEASVHVCPERLHIQTIGASHAAALASLEAAVAAGALRIDATAVTDVDATGLQLLHVLLETARARGIPVTLDASETVMQSSALLGLELRGDDASG